MYGLRTLAPLGHYTCGQNIFESISFRGENNLGVVIEAMEYCSQERHTQMARKFLLQIIQTEKREDP